jgi:hypothetical protein
VLGSLLVGLLATTLVGHTPHRIAGGVHPSVPSPDIIRGVTMTLEAATPDTTRVRFEICGPDVTQIPRGFPVGFRFDTPIHIKLRLSSWTCCLQ